MRCGSWVWGLTGMLFACAALAQEPCAPRASGPSATPDPRSWIQIGALRICGLPKHDEGVAQKADILVWEMGEASWAKSAAFLQPGAVIVAERRDTGWQEVRRLRSPQPAAYGGFGTQLASNGRWLAVISLRPQSVWVFDLTKLESAAQEIEGVRGFAQTVTMLGERIIVGGHGEARIFQLGERWTLTERVAAPTEAADAFSGQIAAQDDVVVSSASGLKNGDGGALPGRVDVFRRHAQTGWRWEARLAPTQDTAGFGQDCCVALDRGQVLVTMGRQRWRFAREVGGWQPVTGDTQ